MKFIALKTCDEGRCHDNARCESMWARMKNELFYSRGRRSTDYTTELLFSFRASPSAATAVPIDNSIDLCYYRMSSGLIQMFPELTDFD